MALKIPVAHDFICPWCWIALSQTERLRREFDVEFEWLGYELMPEGLDWPEHQEPRKPVPTKPPTPSRLDLALAAEGLEPLTVERPHRMRSRNALLAVEHAKTVGKADALVKALYEALYLRGMEINRLDVLAAIAEPILGGADALLESIRQNRHGENIVCFDDDAYAAGVFNVPTFFIGGERYAEQPYSVLRRAVAAVAEPKPLFWRELRLPDGPPHRPYTAIVMAQTLDGAVDLQGQPYIGTKDDQFVLKTLEEQFDASVVGAETVRKAPAAWRSRSTKSFVLSRSGRLPSDSEHVKQAEVVGTDGALDLEAWVAGLRNQGVKSLLIEGGPSVNRQFLELDLVDELFLTTVPTISMGRVQPTIAGRGDRDGRPIRFALVDERRLGDEWFARYRVVR